MKEFDLEKIGKQMPYKAPSEEFFSKFNSEMVARATQKEVRTTKLTTYKRLIIPTLTAAASLFIGLFIVDKFDHEASSSNSSYLISDNLDASIDSYFNSLSDDELAYLLVNTSSQDDFYLTLPDND